jgi:hypothetical protein
MNGYPQSALAILQRSGVRNVILIDGEDLTLVMKAHVELGRMLDAKIEAAQTRGAFYIHSITGKSKLSA